MKWCHLLLALLVLVAASPASADESGLPQLGEHLFVPVLAMPEPFITTHVDAATGLGWTVNSTVPVYSLEDSTLLGTAPADQFLTSIGFSYQQGVQDWLAVNLAMNVVGRLGTDAPSLLADGVTGALSFELGWLMRIYKSEKVQVSGSLGLDSGSATFVRLLDWAYAISEGVQTDLVRSRSSLGGKGGLHAAWGISRRFGLLGFLGASYRESFTGMGENSWYSNIRMAVSYDLRHDLKIPLGLALSGGRFENEANSDSDAGTWFWNLRIALQGRSDFTLGLEFGAAYFDVASQSNRVQFADTNINLRYYY